MRKCPSCGRSYSDMVEKCPSCNVALTGNQEQVVVNSSHVDESADSVGGNWKNNTQTNTKNSTQSSADTIVKIIWIVTAVAALAMIAFSGISVSSVSMVLGAVGIGWVLGLIPKKVAESKGKQDLGKIALAATTMANAFFGLFASIPTLIVFIAIAFLT